MSYEPHWSLPSIDDWPTPRQATAEEVAEAQHMARQRPFYAEAERYRTNGGMRCDVNRGPCNCGAFH